MKIVAIVVCLIVVTSLAEAKAKSRSFNLPCDTVYTTAKRMASEKPYTLDSAEAHTLFIETGSFWTAGSQNLIVNFDGARSGCNVTISAPYSGLRRNGTVFLDRLEKTLVEVK